MSTKAFASRMPLCRCCRPQQYPTSWCSGRSRFNPSRRYGLGVNVPVLWSGLCTCRVSRVRHHWCLYSDMPCLPSPKWSWLLHMAPVGFCPCPNLVGIVSRPVGVLEPSAVAGDQVLLRPDHTASGPVHPCGRFARVPQRVIACRPAVARRIFGNPLHCL